MCARLFPFSFRGGLPFLVAGRAHTDPHTRVIVDKHSEWFDIALEITYLKARFALCEHVCTSLALEFDREGLTVEEKTAIASRWNSIKNDGYVLRFMMDLVKRHGRESRGEASFEPGAH
jgi:hypothetical protein